MIIIEHVFHENRTLLSQGAVFVFGGVLTKRGQPAHCKTERTIGSKCIRRRKTVESLTDGFAAEGAYHNAAGQYLGVMQEDMQNGGLMTDAEHDMYLQFVANGRKVLDSARETFAVWSEKLGTAKEGLNKLFSGLMATARADGKEKAQADIQSEMDAMQRGAEAQDELLTSENVSIDGGTAGNDVSPLAQNDGSDIINEGAKGDIGNAGGTDAQASGTGVTYKQGAQIPDDILTAKPLYSPNISKWLNGGGEITVENGAWKYTNQQGVSVIYVNGYPDFKGSGHVKQEVDIGPFNNRSADFKLADEMAPNGPQSPQNSWHHHEDMKTMQEINRNIHRTFSHIGGFSNIRSEE